MRTLRLLALVLPLGIAAAFGCSENADVGQREDLQTEMDKADWLEKTSRVLRSGDGLGPADDFDALMAMPKDDIVDLWMQDRRFVDTVLAFNLYYLGRSVERVRLAQPIANGFPPYDQMVFAWPQAIAAAQAVVKGGDYFSLYSGSPPVFRFNNGFVQPQPDGGPSDRETAASAFEQALSQLAENRVLQACGTFTNAFNTVVGRFQQRGLLSAFEILQRWSRPSTPDYPLTVDCGPTSTATGAELLPRITAVKNAVDVIFAALDANPAPDRIDSIADMVAIPVAAEGLPPIVQPLTPQGFFQQLPATSTNFQRKRASYILKTYFCDDLTPLSIPANEEGDGGADHARHASNPNCQACHYRLDPIGALFRNHGAGGQDFSGQPQMFFDDGVFFTAEQRERYLDQWRNADGTFRAGYFVIGRDGKPQREALWTAADGDGLRGLWSYLPRSKVVKSCLVRRLAEYVLGPKQVYDREWLEQISRSFSAGPQSGAAFKGVVKALVLSKTFSTHDPRSGTCYDLPASAGPNRSPCAIAHIVGTHCAGCHDSTDGAGHLDFTTWKETPDGFAWAHDDAGGRPFPRRDSFRLILERITSQDRNVRMPFQRAPLPESDLATFRDWLTTQIEAP